MEANKDEAVKCFKMAKSAFSRQDYQKALKLSTKANNMFPCPEYESFMQMCSSKVAEGSSETPREEPTHFDQETNNRREGSSAESNDRRATSEQEALCRKIVKSKNYYDMLDVSKTDSVDKIKRNYKKLALKLHPDKNPSPLASEAFKKVSTAFQCLTNPKAREEYDLYGDEERVVNQRRYQQDFVTPEQLFEAFFGMNHQNHIFHYSSNTHHHHNNNQNRSNVPFAQFIPLFILLAFIMISNYISQNAEVYSYQKTNKFSKMVSTSVNGVVYYVNPKNFEYKYPPKTPERIKLDYEVEYKFFQEKCNTKKRENQNLINTYRSSFKSPPKELFETPKSCEVLGSLRQVYTNMLRTYEYL